MVLEKSVGLFKAAEVIGRVGTRRTSVAAMQQIIDLDATSICNLLKEEQPQTVALVLSYLTAQKGSEVLKSLPESLQEQVIERLATLASTPIEVVETVGEVLSKKIGRKVTKALNQTGGIKAAAATLNAMDKTIRLGILNKLDERVPDLVRSIRMKMFTFDDLATLDVKSLQKIRRPSGHCTERGQREFEADPSGSPVQACGRNGQRRNFQPREDQSPRDRAGSGRHRGCRPQARDRW
jgi:flagellar motor switch protein FliG